MKNKIAFLISGKNNHWNLSFETLKNKYNLSLIDFYFHTWSENSVNDNKLIETFKPKNFLIENSKTFDTEIEKITDYLDLESFNRGTQSLYNTISYLYSRKKSFELLDNQEYDIIVAHRFDVFNYRGVTRDEGHLSYLEFDENLDMNFVYSKIWNQLNAGLPDHWFYSNYDNMRIVMNLYDNLIEYLKPDSEYRFSVCNNWPFSNYENEFSNEILKDVPLRSNNMRNPCHDSILNNHYIYKWHFYKNNILEKTKYVGKYF